MKEDLYKKLGVKSSSSAKEIKKAFHDMARKYHPDTPNGNEEKFKEIQAAYETLSDPDKRAIYDRKGLSGLRKYSVNAENIDLEDLFSQIFIRRDSDKTEENGFFGSQTIGSFVDFDNEKEIKVESWNNPLSKTIKVNLKKNQLKPGSKVRITLSDGQTKKFILPENIHDGSMIRLKGQGYYGEDLLLEIIAI